MTSSETPGSTRFPTRTSLFGALLPVDSFIWGRPLSGFRLCAWRMLGARIVSHVPLRRACRMRRWSRLGRPAEAVGMTLEDKVGR